MQDVRREVVHGITAAILILLVSCMTIGETGGMSTMLVSYIVERDQGANFVALLKRDPEPDKVRFGYSRGCREHTRYVCVDLAVGPEIENRADVLSELERLARDPCQFRSDPMTATMPRERSDDFFGFFGCGLAVQERPTRFIEIQTLPDPFAYPPIVSKVRSYRIP